MFGTGPPKSPDRPWDEVDASLEEEVAGTSWTLLRWQQTASVTVGLEAQVVIATVGVAGIAARVPLFPSHVVSPLLNTSTGAHDARRGKIVVWTWRLEKGTGVV